jgi:phosphotransferase system HPr (HPr) family protein
MIRKKLKTKIGLHARPAAVFVQEARKYDSRIFLDKDGGDPVNGKSIMGILTLAAGPGSIVYLEVDGPDEEECFAVLEDILVNGLKEVEN